MLVGQSPLLREATGDFIAFSFGRRRLCFMLRKFIRFLLLWAFSLLSGGLMYISRVFPLGCLLLARPLILDSARRTFYLARAHKAGHRMLAGPLIAVRTCCTRRTETNASSSNAVSIRTACSQKNQRENATRKHLFSSHAGLLIGHRRSVPFRRAKDLSLSSLSLSWNSKNVRRPPAATARYTHICSRRLARPRLSHCRQISHERYN